MASTRGTGTSSNSVNSNNNPINLEYAQIVRDYFIKNGFDATLTMLTFNMSSEQLVSCLDKVGNSTNSSTSSTSSTSMDTNNSNNNINNNNNHTNPMSHANHANHSKHSNHANQVNTKNNMDNAHPRFGFYNRMHSVSSSLKSDNDQSSDDSKIFESGNKALIWYKQKKDSEGSFIDVDRSLNALISKCLENMPPKMTWDEEKDADGVSSDVEVFGISSEKKILLQTHFACLSQAFEAVCYVVLFGSGLYQYPARSMVYRFFHHCLAPQQLEMFKNTFHHLNFMPFLRRLKYFNVDDSGRMLKPNHIAIRSSGFAFEFDEKNEYFGCCITLGTQRSDQSWKQVFLSPAARVHRLINVRGKIPIEGRVQDFVRLKNDINNDHTHQLCIQHFELLDLIENCEKRLVVLRVELAQNSTQFDTKWVVLCLPNRLDSFEHVCREVVTEQVILNKGDIACDDRFVSLLSKKLTIMLRALGANGVVSVDVEPAMMRNKINENHFIFRRSRFVSDNSHQSEQSQHNQNNSHHFQNMQSQTQSASNAPPRAQNENLQQKRSPPPPRTQPNGYLPHHGHHGHRRHSMHSMHSGHPGQHQEQQQSQQSHGNQENRQKCEIFGNYSDVQNEQSQAWQRSEALSDAQHAPWLNYNNGAGKNLDGPTNVMNNDHEMNRYDDNNSVSNGVQNDVKMSENDGKGWELIISEIPQIFWDSEFKNIKDYIANGYYGSFGNFGDVGQTLSQVMKMEVIDCKSCECDYLNKIYLGLITIRFSLTSFYFQSFLNLEKNLYGNRTRSQFARKLEDRLRFMRVYCDSKYLVAKNK